SVSPKQLNAGIVIPFTLRKGSVFKISYEVTAASHFTRSEAKDCDSELFGWHKEGRTALFVRATSGSSGDRSNAYTLPLRMESLVDSTNFMSISARMFFPFAEEAA